MSQFLTIPCYRNNSGSLPTFTAIRGATREQLAADRRLGSSSKLTLAHLSPRALVLHGDTVYLAGIVADSPKGKSMRSDWYLGEK